MINQEIINYYFEICQLQDVCKSKGQWLTGSWFPALVKLFSQSPFSF